MLKKILMLLLPLTALIGGAFGGDMLRPEPPADETAEAEQPADPAVEKAVHTAGSDGAPGWFTFSNQFFVPMVRNGDMGALMILTLSLETTQSELGRLGQLEHRLRDALLRQLMIAANTGGFDGNFTAEGKLRPLREHLLKAARDAGGDTVKAVLIEDIARQDRL
ncbi:hypothetical protein [Paracoccus sp. (in: a-proteobacteria)]|uniref:hypothetical protein n=1 Tax=Paracoccus sp. TaxID=267 RepID=UPI003A863769